LGGKTTDVAVIDPWKRGIPKRKTLGKGAKIGKKKNGDFEGGRSAATGTLI